MGNSNRSFVGLFIVFVAVVLTQSAFAQKSADTVRLPLSEPISVVDAFHNLQRENAMFSHVVFDALTVYDQVRGDYVPLLAKSYKRVSPTSIEFELRDDVKFHNGNQMDADDVVYTIGWLIDPKSKVQSQQRYNWITSVDKLGPYKVRINSGEVNAADMLNLSTVITVYDEQVFRPLTDKQDYGRAPVGTGPFKITQVDQNKGIVAIRNEDFKHGPESLRSQVKVVHGLPVPDRSVQIANLITGNVDAIFDPSEDQLKELTQNPDLAMTSLDSFSMLYIQLDAINRSGVRQLQDPRVRKALYMAIDRQPMVSSLVSGGSTAKLMDGMCFREMLACDYSTTPPAYDPDGAKKLLAEAGYPNGFELALTARPVTKDAAVAIVGYWRKIGINATVDLVTLNAFTSKRAAGQLAAYFGERPYASFPDAGYALDVNFANESRDYWRDPLLLKAIKDGAAERDEAKRKAIYREAFDHINTQFYMMPISSLPQTFAHVKGLEIKPSPIKPQNADIDVFHWK